MKSRIVWWILTVLCAGGILFFSCQSVSASISLSGGLTDLILEQDPEYQEMTPEYQVATNNLLHDKLRKHAHTLVFAALAFCASMLVRSYTRKWWMLIAVPACMVFALLDEGVQRISASGRTFEMSDIYRDWRGVLLGTAAAALIAAAVWLLRRCKQGETKHGVSGTGAG